MPTTVRDRVHAVTEKESNGKRGLLFEDRTGNEITESVNDDTHGYDMPAGVEQGDNDDTNKECNAEDEEHTEREPTDNDVKIINNPPIKPAPISIEVNDDNNNKTAGVEENNDDNRVRDEASDDKNTGVHEDDENTGL